MGLVLMASVIGGTTAWAVLGPPPPEQEQLQDQAEPDFPQEVIDGGEVELAIGDSWTVTLESNPTTGFQWALIENSDQTLLQEAGHKYVPYENTDPPLPGVGGKELWTFKALQKGETTITMEYSQLWEGGMKAAKTFVLTVVIK